MRNRLFILLFMLLPIVVSSASFGDNITSISLVTRQQTSEGLNAYWNGEEMVYPPGYEIFDLKLNFMYTIEQGIYSNYCEPTLDKEGWNYPGELLTQLKNIYSNIGNLAADYDFSYDDNGFSGAGDYDFVDGRFRSYDDSILIRVSPSSSDLTNAKISLRSSDGDDLVHAGLFEFVGAKKYIGEDGLWVVKFKINDTKACTQWSSYASYFSSEKVYAVSVTYHNDNDGVVSEYELSLDAEQAKHSWNFTANSINVTNIHNRYIQTENFMNGETQWTDDPEYNSGWFCHELTWHPNVCENYVDDGDVFSEKAYSSILFRDNLDIETEQNSWNACDRHGHIYNNLLQRTLNGVDNRTRKNFLRIQFSEDQAPEGETGEWAKIEIEFPSLNELGERTPIKGFFVTLDNHFALESDNSEINAWATYEFRNVALYNYDHGKKETDEEWKRDIAVTLQKGNHGEIFIKDARNLNDGDVIGFRVHAVNLDGTFTDPDGRAFYVVIGNDNLNHKLSFDVTVEDNEKEAYAVQNLVDGKNPIAEYNKDQLAAKSNDRFFNRPSYLPSYMPTTMTYRCVLVWRGENPAIRGDGDENTNAYWPVAGTGTVAYGGETWYNEDGISGTYVTSSYNDTPSQDANFNVQNFFDFWYSSNENADIEDKTGDVENEWTKFNDYVIAAPNGKTMSMKASIKPFVANRLLDNETYHITMIIQCKNGQTDWKNVNTYDIDITKVMPTEMPSDFGVKANTFPDGKWTIYLRPMGVESENSQDGSTGNSNPWTITWANYDTWDGVSMNADLASNFDGDINMNTSPASTVNSSFHRQRWGVDARPFYFTEIFRGLVVGDYYNDLIIDQNYYFVFTGSGDFNAADAELDKVAGDAANKDKDAIAVYKEYDTVDNPYLLPDLPDLLPFEEGNYRLPPIHWSHLGETKAVNAGYIYRNISAKMENDSHFKTPMSENSVFHGLSINNSDLVLPAVPVKVGTKSVTVKYACAWEAGVTVTGTNPIINGKVTTNEFGRNDDIFVDANAALFNLASKKWKQGATEQVTVNGEKIDVPFQAYFNSYLNEMGLDIALKSDGKTVATKPEDIANGIDLATMIQNQYQWIDIPSLRVIFNKPQNYMYSDYYDEPYWAKDGGALTSSDSFKDIIGIGLKRKIRTSSPNLNVEDQIEGAFYFNTYDIWFHKHTFTIPFTIIDSDVPTCSLEVPDVTANLRQKIKLPIELANKEKVVAYQFDLTLPEGFTLAKDSKGLFLAKKTNRYEDENQVVSITQLEDGSYRFICFSMENGKIIGTVGPVLNAYLTMNHGIALGSYQGKISNIILTKADQQQTQMDVDKFVITVNDLAEGDANGDGELNVSDIVEIVNYIMQKPSGQFISRTSDLNGDGDVNVTDVVVLVDLIMAPDASRSSERTLNVGTAKDQLTLIDGNGQSFGLWLINETTYVASQFDIRLSSGQTLEAVALNYSRAGGHMLFYEEIRTGLYRVVVFSLTGNAYRGDSGELVTISVKGQGEVSVENSLFVTADAAEKRFGDLHCCATTIGTARLLAEPADIYTTDGRRVRSKATTFDGLSKGVYIVNGKKKVVK